MFKEERQSFIFRQINLHNKVLSKDLCEMMKVSEDTIRRDLNELSEAGKLIKVHGGALSLGFNEGINGTNVYALNSKIIIARKALSFLKDGMFVLTSGGTTILEMIKLLPPDLNCTFITGSIPVISKLMDHPRCEVIVLGDKLDKSSKLAVGTEAIRKIEQLNADICFIGVNALDTVHGLTDNDWDVVQVKKSMMASSKKIVCMTISEKIPSVQPINVSGVDKIDVLITELSPKDRLLKPFRDRRIEVL